MTDLVESSTWTPGIRQFETSDPVEGGPDGIDNVPLRQLANRTRFLKDVQDAQAGGLEMKAPLASPAFTGSPQAPVPPQFDNTSKIATTSFVQQAAGNFQTRKYVNGSAALAISDTGSWIEAGGAGPSTITLPAPATSNLTFTITNVTSNGAQVTISTPSASIYNQGLSAGTFALDVGATVELVSDASNWTVIGHYTRSPIAQTPAQFDNSTKLATTAFVQRALGNFNSNSGTGSGILAAAVALTNDDVGGFHYFNGPTNQTATLPSEVGLPPGAAITFQRGAQYSLTIGTNKANAIIDTTIGLASSITLTTGEFVVLVWSGTYWQAFGTYTQRVGQPFANSLTSNGYQKLPSGMIVQWGAVTCPANYSANQVIYFNFPIAFPNQALQFVGSNSGIAVATSTESQANNLSQGQVFWGASSASAGGLALSYIAIGR